MIRNFSKKIGKHNSWDPNGEMAMVEEDRKRAKALVKLEKAKHLAKEADQIAFKDIENKRKKRQSLANDLLPVPGKDF